MNCQNCTMQNLRRGFGMEIIVMAYTRQGGERCAELTERLSDRGYQCKGYLFHKYNDIRFEKAQLEAFVDAEEIIGAAFVRK